MGGAVRLHIGGVDCDRRINTSHLDERFEDLLQARHHKNVGNECDTSQWKSRAARIIFILRQSTSVTRLVDHEAETPVFRKEFQTVMAVIFVDPTLAQAGIFPSCRRAGMREDSIPGSLQRLSPRGAFEFNHCYPSTKPL
jgi:hypothetical protein